MYNIDSFRGPSEVMTVGWSHDYRSSSVVLGCERYVYLLYSAVERREYRYFSDERLERDTRVLVTRTESEVRVTRYVGIGLLGIGPPC